MIRFDLDQFNCALSNPCSSRWQSVVIFSLNDAMLSAMLDSLISFTVLANVVIRPIPIPSRNAGENSISGRKCGCCGTFLNTSHASNIAHTGDLLTNGT